MTNLGKAAKGSPAVEGIPQNLAHEAPPCGWKAHYDIRASLGERLKSTIQVLRN